MSRERMPTLGRAVLILAAIGVLAGCMKPSVLHVDLHGIPKPTLSPPTAHGNYQATMESIVAFMKEELGVPFPPRVSLHLYPDQWAFERGLQEEAGFEPMSAIRTAGYASAVATNAKVLVNEADVFREPWKRCVEILAHELIHVSQRHLAEGRRGWSVQWLREGFAEWGATMALDRLGFESREVRFAKARGQVRWVFDGGDLPALSQLRGQSGWAAVQDKPGGAASYELSLLATDLLISRVGVPSVIEYFKNAGVLDPRGNFTRAFGVTLFEFEEEFKLHLQGILR
jgi:hypothetical protein